MTDREKFEAWLESTNSQYFTLFEREVAWRAWQASRKEAFAEFNAREDAIASAYLENALKPTRATPRTPIVSKDEL